MDRRSFMKKSLVTAGLLATPEILVPEKHFWTLDKTMVQPEGYHAVFTHEFLEGVQEDEFHIIDHTFQVRKGSVQSTTETQYRWLVSAGFHPVAWANS